MFDLDKYLVNLVMSCRSAFGERLLYMGLQHAAQPHSLEKGVFRNE